MPATEVVQFFGGRDRCGGDNVRDDDLPPLVVRNTDDERIRHRRVLVQRFLDLHRVDVLAAGQEHVVLASDDRHELLLVPGGEVADVQPAVPELLLLLLRGIEIGVGAFRGADDDLADLGSVPRDRLVRVGEAVVEQLDHGDVVVDAGPPRGPGHVRQIRGPQESVPETFGAAVAVEDSRVQHLLVVQRRLPLEGRTHRNDAFQGGQVAGLVLLGTREHRQVGRGADQERQPVLLDVVERDVGVEAAQRHQRRTEIERGIRSGAVQPTAVEPRRHVQRLVFRRQREVHDHVVGAEDLDHAVERDALRHAGRSRREQPGGLVPHRASHVRRRRRLGDEVVEPDHLEAVPRHGLSRTNGDDERGLVCGARQRVPHHLADLGVVDEHRGTVRVEDERRLAGREAEVHRRSDCPAGLPGRYSWANSGPLNNW